MNALLKADFGGKWEIVAFDFSFSLNCVWNLFTNVTEDMCYMLENILIKPMPPC